MGGIQRPILMCILLLYQLYAILVASFTRSIQTRRKVSVCNFRLEDVKVHFAASATFSSKRVFFFFYLEVVERRKQIEIEEQEIQRKEKELMSTVKLPAEAEAYKVQTIAEGKRYGRWLKDMLFRITEPRSIHTNFRTQTVEAARAEAERVRLTGAAEARAIEAVGRAEAEKMRMKASAYKQYGDAAVMALVLEALPQVKTFDVYTVMVTFGFSCKVQYCRKCT
jgi:flotillin